MSHTSTTNEAPVAPGAPIPESHTQAAAASHDAAMPQPMAANQAAGAAGSQAAGVAESQAATTSQSATAGPPLVSVVVPVYNVERYLDSCLDSLQTQTLSAIEIIAVNDGSTDGSLAALQRRAAEDPRIKIVDKPNGGLSSARNAGIMAAAAPIVCFLDSDDTFVPEACEVLAATFQATEADLVTFGANCLAEDPTQDISWYLDYLSPRDAVFAPFEPDLLFKERSRPFAWRTAARTAFLRDNGLLFDETVKFGEDQVFHFAVYPRASKTVLLSDKLYNYRIARDGGMMSRVEADPALKMEEHVKIADAIFADWARAGLLEPYAAHMMAWLVEFLLFDSLKLPVPQRTQMFAAAGKLAHLHASQLVDVAALPALGLPKAEADIVSVALEGAALSDRKARALANAYYVHRYGKMAALRKALNKFKH